MSNVGLKPSDNFWTTFFVTSWSPIVGQRLARRGVRPNSITLVSLMLGIGAAVVFSRPGSIHSAFGGVLLHLSFTADCLDGQVARLNDSGSAAGAALDWWADRIKDVAIVVGLGAGAVSLGGDGWWWAVALFVVLSTRAQLTQSFEAHRSDRKANSQHEAEVASGFGYWIRSLAAHPYGDRMGLTTLGAIFAGPLLTLQMLTGVGLAAFCLQVWGRFRRSESGWAPEADWSFRGDGPLARSFRRSTGRMSTQLVVGLLFAGCVGLGLGSVGGPAVVACSAVVLFVGALGHSSSSDRWFQSCTPVVVLGALVLSAASLAELRFGWVVVAGALYLVQGIGVAKWRFLEVSGGTWLGWEPVALVVAAASLLGPSTATALGALGLTLVWFNPLGVSAYRRLGSCHGPRSA